MATKSSNHKINTFVHLGKDEKAPFAKPRKVSFAQQDQDAIKRITSVKSLANFHRYSYVWKIHSFRHFMDAQSSFELASPTFTCPTGPHQLSEWYLSVNYSPVASGSIRIGIFLINLKGEGSNEIRAHVTLSTLRAKGGLAMNFGTVKRNFKIRDRGLVANRNFGNVSSARKCCEQHSRSDCHEWFGPISLRRLSDGGSQAVLGENVLSLKTDIKVWEWTDRILATEPTESLSIVPYSRRRSDKSAKLPNPTKFWEQRPNPDCVIMCDDGIFRVHRNILAAASPTFTALIEGLKFKEDDSMPSDIHLPAIIIKGTEASIVAIILECIYSGTLGTFEKHHMNSETATKLFQTIEHYNIASAKTLLFKKLVNELNWSNAGNYAILAQKFKAPSDLKAVMNKYLRRNWGILQQSEEFRELVKSHPAAFESVLP